MRATVLVTCLALGCSSSNVNPGSGGGTNADASSGGAGGAGAESGPGGCADLGGGLLGTDGSVESGLGQWYANDGVLAAAPLAACGTQSIRLHTSEPEAPSARYPVSAAAVAGKTYELSFCLRSEGIGREITVDTFSDGGVGASVTVYADANAWTSHHVPSTTFPSGGSPALRFVIQASSSGGEVFIDCVNLIETVAP
jgi:hypothetical protein